MRRIALLLVVITAVALMSTAVVQAKAFDGGLVFSGGTKK